MVRGAVGALKGKDIGFVGDRAEFTTPTPTLLKSEKPWKWISVDIHMDELVMEHFYAIPINTNAWYTPPQTAETIKVKVPRLLLLPSMLVPFFTTPRTPLQLLRHTRDSISTTSGGAAQQLHAAFLLLQD